MELYQMGPVQRESLKKARTFLIQNVVVNEDLWSECISSNILSDEMLEQIREGKTRSEQTSAFIQLMPKRGPTAFQKFIDVLARTDQGHVADYLKKTEAEEKMTEMIRNAQDIYTTRQTDPMQQLKLLMEDQENYFRNKYERLLEEENDKVEELHDENRQLEKNLRYEQVQHKCYKEAFRATAKAVHLATDTLVDLVDHSRFEGSIQNDVRTLLKEALREVDTAGCEDKLIEDMQACKLDFRQMTKCVETLADIHLEQGGNRNGAGNGDESDDCNDDSSDTDDGAAQHSVKSKLENAASDVNSVLAGTELDLTHHSKLRRAVSTITFFSESLPVLMRERNTVRKLEGCLIDLRVIVGDIKSHYDDGRVIESKITTKKEEIKLMERKQGMRTKMAKVKKTLSDFKGKKDANQASIIAAIQQAISKCDEGLCDRSHRNGSAVSGFSESTHHSEHDRATEHEERDLRRVAIDHSRHIQGVSSPSHSPREDPPLPSCPHSSQTNPKRPHSGEPAKKKSVSPGQRQPTTFSRKTSVGNESEVRSSSNTRLSLQDKSSSSQSRDTPSSGTHAGSSDPLGDAPPTRNRPNIRAQVPRLPTQFAMVPKHVRTTIDHTGTRGMSRRMQATSVHPRPSAWIHS